MRQGDKVAIVTGASTGIGQASAKTLHQAGFRVFGTTRRSSLDVGDGITMITCDVTDDASVKQAVDKVLEIAGRIDVLVYNAGIGLLGGAEESSINQAQALFDVNLFGVMRATNAVLPAMRDQKAGRIINISSVLGLIPAPYLGPLLVYEARPRRIFGVPRSRGAELRHSSLLARAGVHSRFLRTEHGVS